MKFTVLGCGDAFASGGQLNTCFHLQHQEVQVLLDCGATSLIAMRRQVIASVGIDYIILSHFHGDHFGGVPFLLLDSLVNKRTRPLTIISPPGGEARITQLLECLYPGVAQQISQYFTVNYLDFSTSPVDTPHFEVKAVPVIHSPESLPHAIRLEWGGKTIGFSGDTEWTDALLPIADQADLFVCECNEYDKASKGHISYHQLEPRLPHLRAKKTALTHLGESMLAHKAELAVACLEEGQQISIH